MRNGQEMEDSFEEDEVEEDEEEEEVPELPELTEEQEAESQAAFGKTYARRSFIQDTFESKLKCKQEEEEAK